MVGIGIVGLGRIGRTTLKAALRNNLFVPKAIVDVQDPEALADLFAYDSNYGAYGQDVWYNPGLRCFEIGGELIPYINAKEQSINFKELGVDVVMECSGRATKRVGDKPGEGAQVHIDSGAQYVVVGAPSKTADDCDITVLLGYNQKSFDPGKHKIVSMASCTTGGLAPLVKTLEDSFGIEYGLFTTVHAYTNSQALVDQPMKDRRDSWAAAENITPSSSGAAKALKYIWPNLNIDGKAFRVPYRTGSVVELTALVNKDVTLDMVKDALRATAKSDDLRSYVGILEREYASARVLGETKTALIDIPLTKVMGKRMVSVSAWYDNEAGYSARLAELALLVANMAVVPAAV